MAGPTLDDVKISLQKFGYADYSAFILMLVTCSCVGIYFGFFEKKKKSSGEESDYLVGGRQMSVIPVTMSLIASAISGITLLGKPAEIYVNGIQFAFSIIGVILMGAAMSYFYLPVFHDLQITSTYHYLETRFNNRVRLFGALMFVFGMMTWLPIVIYMPALAFNQVTGINVHLITPVVCVVCIFYTCIGGLKAVVWTDAIQLVMMFGAMFLVMIKGTYDVGGFDFVWEKATESGRIELPESEFDLRLRHGMYAVTVGAFVNSLKSHAVSQNMIQRYLSLPTLKDARRALWLFIFGVTVLTAICTYCGLLIYATYHNCDPLTTKLAARKDQVLPLLVMQTLGDFPGLPGLFVAGVFSAALSSLSTGLNSMSAVILEDFIKSFIKKPLTEQQIHYIMRTIVVVFGAICVCLVLVVEKMGLVLQLSISLSSVTNGPLFGIFTIGILIPWVNGIGAICGGISGLGIMAWICAKAQAAIASGEMKFPPKPVDVSGCSYSFTSADLMHTLRTNATEAINFDESIKPDFAIYHISYFWYTLLGALITISVSLVVTFAIGANDLANVDPKLLAPCIRRYLPVKEKREDPLGTEDDIRYADFIDLKAISATD